MQICNTEKYSTVTTRKLEPRKLELATSHTIKNSPNFKGAIGKNRFEFARRTLYTQTLKSVT